MAASASTPGTPSAAPLHPPMAAIDVLALQDRLLAQPDWPPVAEPHPAVAQACASDATGAQALWYWVSTNHRYNSLLWGQEDLARRTQVADADIAANKRSIDRYNQARNDATERVDEWLLQSLGLVDTQSARSDAPQSCAPAGARLNSETAGSMVDRLSIMALKVHAMRQQTQRQDVDETHRAASRVKLERLEEQRRDLAGCLDALLADSLVGCAYFKVYRQFKMYNDPRFNPVLVAEAAKR